MTVSDRGSPLRVARMWHACLVLGNFGLSGSGLRCAPPDPTGHLHVVCAVTCSLEAVQDRWQAVGVTP